MKLEAMLTQMRIVLDKFCLIWINVLMLVALAGCSTVKPAVEPPGVTPPMVETAQRPPRLGLVLGGGAARGFAHVGVIQVLEANGIRPDAVVGTSAGSLVAALYASGKNAAELERVALGMDEATLTDWTMPLASRGLMRGEALAR